MKNKIIIVAGVIACVALAVGTFSNLKNLKREGEIVDSSKSQTSPTTIQEQTELQIPQSSITLGKYIEVNLSPIFDVLEPNTISNIKAFINAYNGTKNYPILEIVGEDRVRKDAFDNYIFNAQDNYGIVYEIITDNKNNYLYKMQGDDVFHLQTSNASGDYFDSKIKQETIEWAKKCFDSNEMDITQIGEKNGI